MTENMKLDEFLEFIASCSGDEGIDLITKFQNGALTIDNIGVEDFE